MIPGVISSQGSSDADDITPLVEGLDFVNQSYVFNGVELEPAEFMDHPERIYTEGVSLAGAFSDLEFIGDVETFLKTGNFTAVIDFIVHPLVTGGFGFVLLDVYDTSTSSEIYVEGPFLNIYDNNANGAPTGSRYIEDLDTVTYGVNHRIAITRVNGHLSMSVDGGTTITDTTAFGTSDYDNECAFGYALAASNYRSVGAISRYLITAAVSDATLETLSLGAPDNNDFIDPTFTSATTVSVEENLPLLHPLVVDKYFVEFTVVGGADSAKFEINNYSLRFASNGTKNFESPDDANTDNDYIATVRATDLYGNTTDQTITVTVTDAPEGAAAGTAAGIGAAAGVAPGAGAGTAAGVGSAAGVGATVGGGGPAARYHRIRVTTAGGGVCSIGEIEFWLDGTTKHSTAGKTVVVSGTGAGAAADVFDGNLATWWYSGGGTGWIGIDFGSGNAVQVGMVMIAGRSSAQYPQIWLHEYSISDGTTWVASGIGGDTGAALGSNKKYYFTDPAGDFLHYRLRWTADSSGALRLARIETRETVGGSDVSSEAVGKVTSEDTVGTVDNMFDGNASTNWATNVFPAYVILWFPDDRAIAQILLQAPHANEDQSPDQLNVDTSPDGITWSNVFTQTGFAAWSTGETRTYNI